MTAGDLLAVRRSFRVRFARYWRRGVTAFLFLLALTTAFAGPTAAATPPGGTLNSTDAMLKWINAYRGKPEPDALPVVRLSTLSLSLASGRSRMMRPIGW